MSIQLINGYARTNSEEIALARRGAYPGGGNVAVARVTRTELVFFSAYQGGEPRPAKEPPAVVEVKPSADVRMKLPYSRLLDRLV